MFVFSVPPTQLEGHTETGPWIKVSPDRLVKPGIEPVSPGLQGKRFINYTTSALTLSLPICSLPRAFHAQIQKVLPEWDSNCPLLFFFVFVVFCEGERI